MRIVLIGQAPFGAKVLEELLKRNADVAAVYGPEAPAPGQRVDPLRELAAQKGLPLFESRELRRPENLAKYKAFKPDLLVMAFVTTIIPEEVLAFPKLGAIQYHPSLLPKHRGRSAINWAIIQGDARTGLTIFWVDKGIDTGPILLQKTVDVAPNDTVGSLYFNKLFPMGVEAMIEAVELVRQSKAPKIPQDAAHATYEPPCDEANNLIDWQRPAQAVYNFIRGNNPQPGARTACKGASLKIFDAEFSAAPAAGQPGEVTGIDAKGVRIALKGGSLTALRVQPAGGGKVPAHEWAAKAGLKAGDRLG